MSLFSRTILGKFPGQVWLESIVHCPSNSWLLTPTWNRSNCRQRVSLDSPFAIEAGAWHTRSPNKTDPPTTAWNSRIPSKTLAGSSAPARAVAISEFNFAKASFVGANNVIIRSLRSLRTVLMKSSKLSPASNGLAAKNSGKLMLKNRTRSSNEGTGILARFRLFFPVADNNARSLLSRRRRANPKA